MKASTLILVMFLLGMVLVVALGVAGIYSQRDTTKVMERVIADLTTRSQQLENELKTVRDEQARREAELRDLAKTAAAGTEASSSVETARTNTRPATPQAFQARAYLGREYVGLAWVVPNNVKENAENGEFRFEPVIWIDEKFRKAFTQTNIVERDVVRNNSYTQVYQQPYWYSYPVWVRPNHPNRPPGQQPPPNMPSPGRPPGSSPPIIGPGDRSTPMGP